MSLLLIRPAGDVGQETWQPPVTPHQRPAQREAWLSAVGADEVPTAVPPVRMVMTLAGLMSRCRMSWWWAAAMSA